MRLSSRQRALLGFSLLMGLLVVALISYKAYDLGSDFSWETVKNTTDWQSVLLVNVLIGISVTLLILELKWDALRVLLTVVVALLFGYLMTAVFSLDAADDLIRGDFRVQVLSDAPSAVDLSYEQDVTADFDPAAGEARYHFAGSEGDEVTILAYATDAEAGLDVQVSLLDSGGEVLETANEASRRFTRQYSDYLTGETDAVIDGFALPANGTYTILVEPEAGTDPVAAELGVALFSDAAPALDLLYNGPAVGDVFNKENADNPVTEARYTFAGSEGDAITVLAYVLRSNVAADLKVALLDADGNTLVQNSDASREQVETYSAELKSTKDAIIEAFILPADGVYTVYTQPEPLTTGTRLSETFKTTNKAYDAFLLGPLSRLNRWVIWIRDALTLIMLGLAIAIVFRANQFSLGAEGQLYFGALASGVVGLTFGDLPKPILVPVALLSAATAGFLWGLLPGALKAYLGANELVSTLMLNTIAQRFYEMVLTFQLQPPDAGYTASEWIPENGLLPPIIDLNGDTVTVAVYLLIFLVLLTWVLIQRTPIGYEIRMIGANIKFADFGGVNTRRTIMLTMAISGIVAGLAGAHLAMGIHRKLILNISIGLAFEGVVVALLARNNPLVVPFTGLLYAYLRTGSQVMERDTNISAEVVRIIQAVVILLITAEALVTFFRRRRIQRRGTIELDIGDSGDNNGTTGAASGGTLEGAHV
ncbi:MAG: ABC transporter permease [Anaerolineae bacterium]|nr:ABC transporter permease [Anaerolineae bacterium]